jgi:GNAT superfamily N-acetyltransferase
VVGIVHLRLLDLEPALPGEVLRVSYLQLCAAPGPPRAPPSFVQAGGAPPHIAREHLTPEAYLGLYRRVGKYVRWDQRLLMPAPELATLLASGHLEIYVLRSAQHEALGLCEFDRSDFPLLELKNFGLVPQVQGCGLGQWLLSVALHEQWHSGASRIWLHTDTWDHPAALRTYLRAGFSVYAVRDEAPGTL